MSRAGGLHAQLLDHGGSKHSFDDQNLGTYRRSNLSSKKDGAGNHGRIKSDTKKQPQVFALIVFPGIGRFRL